MKLSARQEPIEFCIQFRNVLHTGMFVKHTLRHNHAHVAQGFQVVQGILGRYDKIGCLAFLNGTRLLPQPQDARVAYVAVCSANARDAPTIRSKYTTSRHIS